MVISPAVSTGTFHRIEISQHPGRDFKIYLDGRLTLTRPDESMRWELSEVMAGQGFDASRVFHGEIRDFKLKYSAASLRTTFLAGHYPEVLWSLAGVSGLLLILLLLNKFAGNLRRIQMFLRTPGAGIALASALLLAVMGLFRDDITYSDLVKGGLSVARYNSSDEKASAPVVRQYPFQLKPREFYASFEFRPDSFGGYPNLFQTAPGNEGLRMEFGADSSLSLIAGKDGSGGVRGVPVAPSVSTGTFHKISISQRPGRDFQVYLDGRLAVTLPDESMRWEFSQVSVGRGFDENRVFRGEIRDFRIKYLTGSARQTFVASHWGKIVAGLACTLALGLMLMVPVRFDAVKAAVKRVFRTFCLLSGLLFLAAFAVTCIFEKRFNYTDIKTGELSVSRFNSSDQSLSVPVLKPFPATDNVREFSLSFEFRPDSFDGYPNLFQTAPVNDGLRMEFGADSSLAIIAGKDEQGSVRGIPVAPSVSTTSYHRVEISQRPESGFLVLMDGKLVVSLPSESMRWELSRVEAGRGFDSNRVFKGELRNFRLNYMTGIPRSGFIAENLKMVSRILLALGGIFFLLFFADKIALAAKLMRGFMMSPESARTVFMIGTASFVAHILLILSGSFDLDRLKYGTIAKVEHPAVSVSDSRNSASHPTFANPAAGRTDDLKEAEFELDFNPKSFDGFPNLFQTAPYNKGLRMELSPTGQLALIGSYKEGGVEGRTLEHLISTGTWYHVRVTVVPEKTISAQIENNKDAIVPLKTSAINMDFSQIMAGTGFDKTRAFDGDIRNFTARYRILTPQKKFFPLIQTTLLVLKTLTALLPLVALWYFSLGPGSTCRAFAFVATWQKTLVTVVLAALALLSSVAYLFDGMEPPGGGMLAKLLQTLASGKGLSFLPNILEPQFYIWGFPLLAISALVLFLSRRDRFAVFAFTLSAVILMLSAAGQLKAGLIALLLMGASYGIGRHICSITGTDGAKDGFLLPLVAGISLNGILFWIAAHFRVNYPITHLYVLLCEAIISYKTLRQLLVQCVRDRRLELAIGQLAILCFALLFLPVALTPIVGWDGHIAHVYIAKQTALFGYFNFSPFYPYGLDHAIIPKGIFSPLFMLGGVAGMKVFIWFLFMILFLGLERFIRERFGALAAFFAVLICMLNPSVFWQIQFIYIDVFELAFGVLLLVHAFNTFEDRSWKNLLVFFALSALSYYGKQSNVIIVIPLTMALAVMPLTRLIREKDFRPAAKFLAASLICPALLAPSFWLNYHITGSPTFQYFNSVFKSFYFPRVFVESMPAPFVDPWRLLPDITFQGARHAYYGAFNQAFGTWFYVLLPVSFWVLLSDRRNGRDVFRLTAVFLTASLLFLYLIPAQLRYFDSILPSGALILALGTTKLLDFAEAGWRRRTVIASLAGIALINLISTFQYPPRGIMPYPLGAIIMKKPIKRPAFEPEHTKGIMDYATRTYGHHSKCLMFYSPLASLADFRVEVYDWYNYRLTQELLSTRKAEVLYDIIFRINKFDFIILTDSRPVTNLDILVSSGLIVPEYHIPGYTLYKPARRTTIPPARQPPGSGRGKDTAPHRKQANSGGS